MNGMTRVTKDGRVYMRVPSECGDVLVRGGYDVYKEGTDKGALVIVPKDGHANLDDVIWVYVGNVCYFNKERCEMFESVKDLADYANEHGKLPWGWRGIVRYQRWTRLPEKGTSVYISDGVNIMRYWNKKKAVLEKVKGGSLSTPPTTATNE